MQHAILLPSCKWKANLSSVVIIEIILEFVQIKEWSLKLGTFGEQQTRKLAILCWLLGLAVQ